MRDITPMTDEELMRVKQLAIADRSYHPKTMLRLLATIDDLKAQLGSYCEQLCTLQDKLAAAEAERDYLRSEAYDKLEMVTGNNFAKMQWRAEQAEAERDQERQRALEEVAKYFEGHGCASGWYRSNIVANIRALAAKEKT